MELRQLAYVVAVAEEGSFTRAAAREHVAQPAVSAQVRRLEAELGQALFARGPGPVTLTAAGAAVLPHARAALAAVAGARTAVDELAGLLRGRVAVGVVPSIGHRLAGVLAAFHAAHPGVEITLAEDTSDALMDGVRTGRLDFALAGVAGAAPPGRAAATVTGEWLGAAVAPGHRLAARKTVTLRALRDEALIALPAGTGGRTALERGFAALGHAPRVALEAGDPLGLLQLPRRGPRVAIVPQAAPEHPHPLAPGPGPRSRPQPLWRPGGAPTPAPRAPAPPP